MNIPYSTTMCTSALWVEINVDTSKCTVTEIHLFKETAALPQANGTIELLPYVESAPRTIVGAKGLR